MNGLSRIFNYKGNEITFSKGDNVMVNATEMAKPFNKVPKDWLRTKQTQEFINSLSDVRQICPTQLVDVHQGNSSSFEQGTWMHEDVALEFARWLSPAFAIWCNDRIKELLTTGVTTVSNDDEAIAYAMNVLQKRLELAKEERMRLEQENKKQQEEILSLSDTITSMQPKISYVDNILASNKTVTVTQIAQDYGMTARAFNILLRNFKIQRKVAGQWILYQPYLSQGYVQSHSYEYAHKNGEKGVAPNTEWTQKGRLFLYEELKRHGVLPLIERQ